MAHTWRRNSVTQTIHNRLLRLHRPFMSRGYREERYRFSLDSAIDASRLVLHAQIALNRAPLLKAGFQLLNVQSAVVILFMDLWTRFEPHQLVTNPDYQLIQMTVPFFTSNLVSRLLPVRNIASQSLQVISLLFDALTNRARVPEGGEVETYGRLLKRIGEVVISTAAAAVSRVNATNPTTALSPSLVPWTGGRPFDNDVLNQCGLLHSCGRTLLILAQDATGGPGGGSIPREPERARRLQHRIVGRSRSMSVSPHSYSTDERPSTQMVNSRGTISIRWISSSRLSRPINPLRLFVVLLAGMSLCNRIEICIVLLRGGLRTKTNRDWINHIGTQKRDYANEAEPRWREGGEGRK